MKKPNQIATKGKQKVVGNAIEKNVAKKTAKPLKAKQQFNKIRAGKKVDAKLILSKKSANKNSEEDEDEEAEQDSGAEMKVNNIHEDTDDEEIDSDEEKDDEEEVNDEEDDEEEDNDEEDDEEEGNEEQFVEENDEDHAESKIKKEKNTKTNPVAVDTQNRTIVVRYLNKNTSQQKIEEVFGKCGKIESIVKNRNLAKIVYANANDSLKATKYHNSVLDGNNILVFHENSPHIPMEEKFTVVVRNTQELTNIEDSSKLKEIFIKCGEINSFNIRCSKFMLAFVTFKDQKSATKALKLNGTEENGFKLDITPYKKQQKTKIYIQNVAKGISENDLIKFFKSCGNVLDVALKSTKDDMTNTSVVTFENEDAYCKSFLLHEEKLGGQMIFIRPFNNFRGKLQTSYNRPNFSGKRKSPSREVIPKTKKPKFSKNFKLNNTVKSGV